MDAQPARGQIELPPRLLGRLQLVAHLVRVDRRDPGPELPVEEQAVYEHRQHEEHQRRGSDVHSDAHLPVRQRRLSNSLLLRRTRGSRSKVPAPLSYLWSSLPSLETEHS